MKNILLIGLGRFGKHIAMQLNEMGHEIMAVDINEERVNRILPFVTNAQIGDSTDASFLESLGIGNFDICFVTIGGSFPVIILGELHFPPLSSGEIKYPRVAFIIGRIKYEDRKSVV